MHVTESPAMTREVSARKVAMAAGLIAAAYVALLFTMRAVPDRVLGLLGGPTGVARWGGVRARVQPADGGVSTIELPGLDEDAGETAIGLLASGGLEMHVVREGSYAAQVGEAPQDEVTIEEDMWRPEDGGPDHTVAYLRAPKREELERAIADAKAAGRLVLPEDSTIGYERLDNSRTGTEWRTYELESSRAISAKDIRSAAESYDPITNRPTVLIDFNTAGSEQFCALTHRIVGQKLATVIGDRVYSAPIINGAICGGHAQVTMGGSDPERQESEADALAAVLRTHPTERVTVLERHWQPPAMLGGVLWLARGVLGLVCGLVLAVLVFVVIRIARPRWRTPPARLAGPFPWRRLLVTLLAPAALLVLQKATLPSVNDVELGHVMARGLLGLFDMRDDTTSASVIALGVAPLIGAFAIVEIVALAIPRLRWRRHDPRGRIALGRATAIVALAAALAQGYVVAVYFERLARGGAEVVVAPGMKFRLLTMVTLATGTMLLAAVAGTLSKHGLGNGYGALLASGSILPFLQHTREVPQLVLYAYPALGAIALVAAATWCVLRWRIDGGGDRRAALRVPASGLEALAPLGGIGYLLGMLVGLGLGVEVVRLQERLFAFEAHTWVVYGSLIMFVPLWAWILARPSLVAQVAMQGGMEAPSRAAWMRAALVSTALFVLAFAVVAAAVRLSDVAKWTVGTAPGILIATAVVLDVIDDARAHRARLVPVGMIHQIQYAAVIERVLGDAGIPCHLHASNLRTLLAFFGPWAPVFVLVPADQADAARPKVDDVLKVARGTLPRARVEAARTPAAG